MGCVFLLAGQMRQSGRNADYGKSIGQFGIRGTPQSQGFSPSNPSKENIEQGTLNFERKAKAQQLSVHQPRAGNSSLTTHN